MRIAILTLPLHTNYGGILQAYALQTVLERMGHKVEVLDKRRREKTDLPLDIKIKRFILKYVLFQKLNQLREDVFYYRHKIENKYTWKFVDKYIHRREITSFNDIKESDYDAIVVGSDQVWRPIFFKNNYKSITNAYLAFAEKWKIKRIAFAPSFGTDTWEYSDEETKECARLLKLFNYISIRESSGVELCLKHFNIIAQHVLDPTLLLNKNDYIKLLSKKSKKNTPKGILCYFLDYNEEKAKLLNYVEQQLNQTSFIVNSRVEDCYCNEIVTQPPLEEWLCGFYEADFIVTDSFHACIFAIIFEKPFIIYENKKRGTARIKSLLNIFDIKNNYYTNIGKTKITDINIDYTSINNKLKQLKQESMSFLKNV